MREINEIILHCSATGIHQDFDISDIRRWHVEGNGWSDVGYNYFIKLDGTLQVGRDIEKIPAHCKGRNKNSIGVCFEGGLLEDMKTPWDKPTDAQLVTWKRLQEYIERVYKVTKVSGHYQYSRKSCPNFCVDILK